MQIKLPFPPSVNSLYSTDWKTKRRFKSKRYADWCNKAESEISYFNFDAKTGPVKITYVFGRPDKRKRDLANLLKAIDDFLVQHQFIQDDSDIHEIHASWGDVVGAQLTIEKLIDIA